jgi:hypothetical protein
LPGRAAYLRIVGRTIIVVATASFSRSGEDLPIASVVYRNTTDGSSTPDLYNSIDGVRIAGLAGCSSDSLIVCHGGAASGFGTYTATSEIDRDARPKIIGPLAFRAIAKIASPALVTAST